MRPNTNVGQRIFPDKNAPDDAVDRATLLVRATVTPANIPNLNVFFASFDLDDPSADAAPIDANGANGVDNNGAVNGSKSGEFSSAAGVMCSNAMAGADPLFIARIDCPVAGNTTAANFKVTMQPGDNFAIAASLDGAYRDEIHVNTSAGSNLINNANQIIPISGQTNPNNVRGIRTNMLTVWRRLHIEVDSMGPAQENYVTGNVNSGFAVDVNRTVTINVTVPDLEVDRFENGRMELAFVTNFLLVVSNTADTVTVKNTTASDIVLSNNVKFDLLGDTNGRTALGTVVTGQTIAPTQTVTLTVAPTVPLQTNLFSNGQMFITPNLKSLKINSNTANTLTVTNDGRSKIIVAAATRFRIYDDDDFNDNDGPFPGDDTLDGDEGEVLQHLELSFRHLSMEDGVYSDGTPKNAFASAYIRLERNGWIQEFNNEIPFAVNVEFDTARENKPESILNANRGAKSVEKDDLWVAYLIVAYQGGKLNDFDPAFEGTSTHLGFSASFVCDCLSNLTCPANRLVCNGVPIGGPGSIIYVETSRDFRKFWMNPPEPLIAKDINEVETTLLHEIGHQLGARGDKSGSEEFFVMDVINFQFHPTGITQVKFHPEHLNIFRRRIKSPGE